MCILMWAELQIEMIFFHKKMKRLIQIDSTREKQLNVLWAVNKETFTK